jgi:hypothetical protein
MELRTQTYQQGTNMSIPWYEECLRRGGGCVENEWDGSTFNFELLSLKLEIKKIHAYFLIDPCSLSVTTLLHTGPG